ncbi:conserved hypothetical protein [Plasmopara halstedii]|uniref:FYVE-type domain-containing protein n=1 Tax=Plasmopara halstedii TaxID=4781 RepID=A0A0N7L3F9_PLAHL|nr:conserved hypothetical protein [Plasmopara halstedii]CEG35763.1 conserved hypothetical protein [Plasmopara halstedii]|eukprot:XP_024572132.1 conserved hypothetical protein [Plasmopara halstedii]
MLALMRDVEREVVNSMIGNHEMMTIWTPRMRKKGIDYYVDDTVAKGFARFCCVGQTDASVIDMMPMFVSTHSKTMLKNARIMNEKVKEAKILSVLQPATGSHPYKSVYIRYTSMDTPKLIYGRDICVCVCTDVIKTRDGSTVGYCLWNSVDMPECPDRFDTDKVVRSKVWNSGFIFRNSGKLNAMTKVCFIVGIELSCVAPQITSRIYMTIFGGSCSRVCQYYRKRFIDPENFKHRAEWISKHETHDCYVCSRLFNPFIKKYNCMRCGEVICKRCFFMEEISVRGAKVIRVRICHYCLEDKGMLAWHLRAIATHDSHHCLTCNGAGVKDLLRHGSVEASQLYIKNNS